MNELAVNMKLAEDSETCRLKFLEYDKDKKGSLESNEFFALIDELGFLFTNKMKAMVMHLYDSDHSGSIEFEEYMAFISRLHVDCQYRIRDIESTARTCLATSGTVKRYIPPRSGVLHLEVLKSYTAAEDSRALTSEQCENLISSAKNTSHPGKVWLCNNHRLETIMTFISI